MSAPEPTPALAPTPAATLFAPFPSAHITPGCVVYHVQDVTQTVGEVIGVTPDGHAVVYSQGKQYTVPVRDLVLVHAPPVLGGGGGFGGLGMVMQHQFQQQHQFHHAAAVAPAPAFAPEAQELFDATQLDSAMDDEEMVNFPLDMLPTFVDATFAPEPMLQRQQQQQAHFQALAHVQTPAADLFDAALQPAASHGDLDWTALTQGVDLDAHLDTLMPDSYMSSLGDLDVQYS
jgi:hypothetical protein